MQSSPETGKLLDYINFKLAAIGCPIPEGIDQLQFNGMIASFLGREVQVRRKIGDVFSPVDLRIQNFLSSYFAKTNISLRLPSETLVLDRAGIARELSLPIDGDDFKGSILQSYRIRQGVLHNPKSDRRTTQGIFHVAEGGLSIPDDKVAVPVETAARIFEKALKPPSEQMRLPFTSNQKKQAHCWVSLLLRPVVCPEVAGFTAEKSMEIRFFAPGSLVANLDFVENIFGNGGDPFSPQNDAALDVEHWSGHTGCVVLAPHLVGITKKEVGLPHWKNATERQRRDGTCWKNANELYNNGNAFKLTCRDQRGLIFTVIADNYFGYCKKEVKTQLSYAANLSGLAEEEHAGGTLVYPSYDLAEEFSGDHHVKKKGHNYEDMIRLYSRTMDAKPEGYAIDKVYPDIFYVSEHAHFDLRKQLVSWNTRQGTKSIKLLPNRYYIRPSGYIIHMEKPGPNRSWRLVGTVAEGTFCHKPCTVSGGGKSEISKPITDAIIAGSVYVGEFKKDFDKIAKIIARDYSDRFRDPSEKDDREVLSSKRSLGSVIKLLSPSADYNDEYNQWLKSIPQYLKELVFVVKRYYKPEWGSKWRDHFSVAIINGVPGNELYCENRKLVTTYLRVGFEQDGSWRVFGLRKDFSPALKVQTEDDISASVVVPAKNLDYLNPDYKQTSYKFIKNCEYKLFQRPDDAIHPGYDKVAEADLANPGNFLSNFEPLTQQNAIELIEDAVNFDKYTAPVQNLILQSANNPRPKYFVCSSKPRIVDGKPSKNPRYLQVRPDLSNPRSAYLAKMSTRLYRRIPLEQDVHLPVNAILPGRRNNPAEPGVRPLAVFNPIHYLELPELMMEFISSLTGKSPSTTGAGSEGALTKGPFNALPPIIDLNNNLIAFALTGHHGFITAAGYVGPKIRVDHDVSLLVPEVWSRMTVEEREPKFLIDNGYLERVQDLEFKGSKIPASRLGWRITSKFVSKFFGRVFNHPHAVLNAELLNPETQDIESFADGVLNIVEAHQRVAEAYFKDGSIEAACPPLKALLTIMKDGQWNGLTLNDPKFRELFSVQSILKSSYYKERLVTQQKLHQNLWNGHVENLKRALESTLEDDPFTDELKHRFKFAQKELSRVKSAGYLRDLQGTLGAQNLEPFLSTKKIAIPRRKAAAPAMAV